MSAHATQATHDDPGPHGTDADTQHHGHVLNALVDLGASFARLLHDQAVAQAGQHAPAQPGPQPAPDLATPAMAPDLTTLATAFDRTARAVRRCIALARALAAPLPPAPDPARHRAAARKRIIRDVEDRIVRTINPNSDAAEALAAELHDRLDAPDLDDDIATRPTADIIAEICRDLGLAAPPGDTAWKRRTPIDLQHLAARAAAPTPQPRPHGPSRCDGQDTAHRSGQPGAQHALGTPAALRHPQPGPAYPGITVLDIRDDRIATVPRPPARAGARWRPPPD